MYLSIKKNVTIRENKLTWDKAFHIHDGRTNSLNLG